MDTTALTAITRKKPSAPMHWLVKNKALNTPVLDYGCGKGFDADHYGFDKYDPNFFPKKPKHKYKTITCIYVLNVLHVEEENSIIEKIRKLLLKNGEAYLAVRRDLKKEGYTSRGTYQRNVILDLPLLTENKSFAIYSLKNT